MTTEKNYDFLQRLAQVHKPNRRDDSLRANAQELEICSGWKLVIAADASPMVLRAAEDFLDYMLVSMNVELSLTRQVRAVPSAGTIVFRVAPCGVTKRGGFQLEVGDGVTLTANEERGVLYGGVRLEDLMNLREAPFLQKGRFTREPLARMRSVHSGCGIDQYPDWQLNAILHAGFTAIDIFVKGIDKTTMGYCNINDVIERALSYGLDTVLYNYVPCYKHPDDADAEEFFDSVYGPLVSHYPKAAAIHTVGESLEFPSHDPRTTGKRWRESLWYGIPDTRPSPGWYPCEDYPRYIAAIRRAIDKANPDLELIFCTYNSGWAPEDVRRQLLAGMPKNVTVQVAYDIFKMLEREGLKCPVMDYSAGAYEPGEYFASEARLAKEMGLRLRATTNMAGLTWDFGCIPYEPIPQRWLKRMLNIRTYLYECGLDSFYENHHYGWWPNPANDLEKEVFFSDGTDDFSGFIQSLARRDYGAEAAEDVVRTWQLWSDAMDHYIASNEDQYGPWRVGPAYPFVFQPNITRQMSAKDIQFPTAEHAHFGWRIIKTLYQPYENENQTPGPLRYPVDLKYLGNMLKQWSEGLAVLDGAVSRMPEGKRENGRRLVALGTFIRNSIVTVMHIKRWWLVNTRMLASATREEMLACMDELQVIANAERKNVEDTVDIVAYDSRLGWEPSMEYVCDPWHLQWKLRQMDSMQLEMDAYRKMIQL